MLVHQRVLEPSWTANESKSFWIGGAKDIAPAALRQRGEKDFRFEIVGHVDHNLRGALDHFGPVGAVLKP